MPLRKASPLVHMNKFSTQQTHKAQPQDTPQTLVHREDYAWYRSTRKRLHLRLTRASPGRLRFMCEAAVGCCSTSQNHTLSHKLLLGQKRTHVKIKRVCCNAAKKSSNLLICPSVIERRRTVQLHRTSCRTSDVRVPRVHGRQGTVRLARHPMAGASDGAGAPDGGTLGSSAPD